MMNLTLKQILGRWDELVAAFYRKNAWAPDTAEIYVNTLVATSGAVVEASGAEQAAKSLLAILECFSEMHCCSITIDGLPYQEALARRPAETHRYHVTVERY